jgi:hypothetical protein
MRRQAIDIALYRELAIRLSNPRTTLAQARQVGPYLRKLVNAYASLLRERKREDRILRAARRLVAAGEGDVSSMYLELQDAVLDLERSLDS